MAKKQVSDLLQFIRESEQNTINGNCDEFLFDELIYCSDIIEILFNNIDICIQIDELIDNDILCDDFLGKLLSDFYPLCDDSLERLVKEYEFEEEKDILKLCKRIEYIDYLHKVYQSLSYGISDFYVLWDNKDLIIRLIQNKETQKTISDWLIETEDEKLRCLDYEELAEKVMEILGEE